MSCLFCLVTMNGVILILFLQIMISSALRIGRFPSLLSQRARMSMKMSKDWRTYLVEFRCTDPAFRFQEFRDIARGMKDGESITESLKEFTVAIPDPASPENPVSCYVKLPNDDIAKDIVTKSATVKRIIDVWGEGATIKEMCTASIDTFHQRAQKELQSIPDLRWKLQFERHGRVGQSGMDPAEKEALLDQLHDVCILVGGTVDLKKPNLNLIYYEDWHTYHRQHIALTALMKSAHEAQLLQTSTNDPSTTNTTLSQEPFRPEKLAAIQVAQTFTPLKYFFGRVVAEGPGIFAKFDLRARPFVGTTSMNAMCSHISASAAQVKAGDKVLDPFCGTGSLLVAAAYLGANVVGSDIDADGLLGGGMIPLSPTDTNNNDKSTDPQSIPPVRGVLPPNQRSKNVNFTRKGGRSQLGLCTMDNFKFYHLQDKVLDLIGAGVDQWLVKKDGSGDTGRDPKILKYDKFDAIIADPPFGRREKMTPSASLRPAISATEITTGCGIGDTSKSNGESVKIQPLFTPALHMGECNSELITTLLRVAMCRLVSQGKLVLWLPTKAKTEEAVVMGYLNTLLAIAAATDGGVNNATSLSSMNHTDKIKEPKLKLERVTAETLNDSLWRWLCVFKLD